MQNEANPPIAKRVPKEITQHGETRIDPYFWLRDREDPDTVAYLQAENTYTEAMLQPSAELREQIYHEMLSRMQQTDTSAPVPEDGFFYYTRTVEGLQYPIYCRKQGSMDAGEQVLLDLNVMARNESYLRLGNFIPSPDHRLLAYSLDTSGDEVYVTRIKDLTTGELLPDIIANTYYGLEWTEDGRSLTYVTLDEALRPFRAWRHMLGSDAATDTVVYEETDERFHLTVHKSRSRHYIWIQLDSAATSEVRYLDAHDSAAQPQLFAARRHDVEYDVEHHGDRFYIRTTEGGRNFRVLTCPINNTAREAWEELIPHREQVMVESVDAFARHIVITEREDGLRRMQIRPMDDGQPAHVVAVPEQAYTLYPRDNIEFDTNILRFEYTSLVTPRTTFDYNMDTRERILVKQMPVLGGYDPSQYETLRLHATSHDGVSIPLSVVYRKDIPRDGSSRALLYGYGSYGISSDPSFSSDRLSLIDRGFVYAIAHIRGGADLGKPWHDAGKLLHKRNTFLDFVAAAEFLIEQRYTSPDRLAIMGGSAGGLLVGAVLNMRPDLFHAAVAKVPFVDVLNTATDPTLPLTVIEYDEWGNSNYKEFWEYIRSYSPYDNVKAQRYPHLLATGGLNDPRVSYWEPAKWVAKLRTLKQGDNLLLLRTNMDAGHGGASGRYERLKETAIDYAFLLQKK